MRSLKTLMSLLLFVSLAGLASAQPGPGTPPRQDKPPTKAPGKSALELALEAAFRGNPDLRVALAKLNESEAELARVRLQVAQKVVTAFRAVEQAQAEIAEAEQHLNAIRKVATSVGTPTIRKAEQALANAKTRLAGAEAELNYLLGKPAVKERDTRTERALYSLHLAQAQLSYLEAARLLTPPRGPATDRIRKALDQQTTVKFNGVSARQALEELQKKAPGLHIHAAIKTTHWDEKVTASLADVPLSAALQLLEDVVGHRVVVRGYGLLIVPQERIPPGAVLLGDFLKSTAPGKTP